MVLGVVYLTGTIQRGDGPTGANHVVKGLSEAAQDEDVEAVILRIDSGGGDALASDTIWEAVMNVREATGKPVVASMGNMCASGGYYAASGADKVLAMREQSERASGSGLEGGSRLLTLFFRRRFRTYQPEQ